jgi:hypothetical protein
MGMTSITYPNGNCIADRHHHFLQIALEIYQCKYCWRSKWQPLDIITAQDFGTVIRMKGMDFAYGKILATRPMIRMQLEDLENIRIARSVLPDHSHDADLQKLVRMVVEQVNQPAHEKPKKCIRASYNDLVIQLEMLLASR